MMRAVMKMEDGRDMVILGLSHGNLERFRQSPLDSFIMIEGKDLGVPVDIMILSGETEMDLMDYFKKMIGPDTEVHIDPSMKSS